MLCCKLHIHDIYYYTRLHFQASSLQPAATGYRFMAHLAWLWCRTVTFYKMKSVVNTRAGYNIKSRTSSVIALRIWTCAPGCFLRWSEGKTRKLKCLYSSRCSFDLELPQYSTCIVYPPERLRRVLFYNMASMYLFLKLLSIWKRQYAAGQRSRYEYNTDWRPRSGVRFPTVLRNFYSPKLSDQHFSPLSVLFSGCLWFFIREYADRA